MNIHQFCWTKYCQIEEFVNDLRESHVFNVYRLLSLVDIWNFISLLIQLLELTQISILTLNYCFRMGQFVNTSLLFSMPTSTAFYEFPAEIYCLRVHPWHFRPLNRLESGPSNNNSTLFCRNLSKQFANPGSNHQ